MNFDKLIFLDNPIKHFITPITPYFICDHFISTEIHKNSKKYIKYEIDTKANDLLKNQNYSEIKNFDFIQVQVDLLDFFYYEILPILINKKINIIIITSQLHLPQIKKSQLTDKLLINKNIILWISQNPIYFKHKKYMGFPYGILHNNLEDYIKFIRKNSGDVKTKKIINLPATVHKHLPENHIRKEFEIFGKSSGDYMNYSNFLKEISTSEFTISTTGDRDDCYRHYECIGLNSIPISNISEIYKDIFEENIIYSEGKEMEKMINTKKLNYNYKKTNKNILTIEYWLKKIEKKIKKIIII
jgi:Ca2+-binding EF-hand superfamily protein